MKNKVLIFVISFFLLSPALKSQELGLAECISLAKENNTAVTIAKQSVNTKKQLFDRSKKNILPNLDLLAGYNHLGEPLQINLGQVRDGIIEGTAQQTTSAAANVYQDITGNPLGSDIQNQIYQTSKDILAAVYPNYNPAISKQDYFSAGLFLRQPIFMGGKLKAVQQFNEQQLNSSMIGLENTQQLMAYNVALQYLQVLYFNSMIEKQQQKVDALIQNQKYADELLKAEIIPPYLKNWADVALIQGETLLENLKLEKENSLITLAQLIGMEAESLPEINEKIPEELIEDELLIDLQNSNNPDVRLLESKKEEASVALKVAKSANYPNIFAIGNYQFFRKDLPLITPPWIVGVELKWTLFDGFETKNKIGAAESLVEETNLLIQQKQEAVDLSRRLAYNKIQSIRNQSESLDAARQQTYVTSEMVRKRMENGLSSVKDVNDALQLQFDSEKLYYTSLVAYYTALASYYYLSGEPEKITHFLK